MISELCLNYKYTEGAHLRISFAQRFTITELPGVKKVRVRNRFRRSMHCLSNSNEVVASALMMAEQNGEAGAPIYLWTSISLECQSLNFWRP